MGENANFVELLLVNPGILGMHMKQLRRELAHRFQVVHVLQNEVRRVKIQPEVIAGNVAKSTTPNGR